ncbi:MAG: hypothetical protein AAB966_03350 [Patescibacteria group bacterium]
MKTVFSKYDPRAVGSLFHARVNDAEMEGAALKLPDYDKDKLKVMLLLVDPQIDFIHENRPLSVKGAVSDTARVIEWIYRNIERLSYIAASMDTHLPHQIFLPPFWRYANGQPVKPFDDIVPGDWKKRVWPVYDFNYEYEDKKFMPWTKYYLDRLNKTDKKALKIWPFHCMLGSAGHSVDPALMEAIMYHSGARSTQPNFLIKGNVPWTENYSIVEPEVLFPSHQNGGVNVPFLQMLETHDRIYIAEQAKDYCVYETVLSIVRYFSVNAPQVLSRIRVLEDCTSPVGDPTAVNKMYDKLVADYGLKMVKSTDPIL